MCIAIIKPPNFELPSRKILQNCFDNNPHGAGFSYVKDGKVYIRKGYDNFLEFYEELLSSNINKKDLAFIHFRIANKGLKDKGNTHPFPICNKIDKLRTLQIDGEKYAIMHNGSFYYNDKEYLHYDPLKIISDTMLFTIKLSEKMEELENSIEFNKKDICIERFVAFNLINKTNQYATYISNTIAYYSKIAIMDGENNFQFYGKWINENGIFYSNDSYLCKKAVSYTYIPCFFCKTYKDKRNLTKIPMGYCCNSCYLSYCDKRNEKNHIIY